MIPQADMISLARDIAYSMDPNDESIYQKHRGYSHLSSPACLNKLHRHGYKWDGVDWVYHPGKGEKWSSQTTCHQ